MITGNPQFRDGAVGYTNASWTLRAGSHLGLVCKALRWMDEHDPMPGWCRIPTDPRPDRCPDLQVRLHHDASLATPPNRSRPWRMRQNYVLDAVGRLRTDLGKHLRGTPKGVRPRSDDLEVPAREAVRLALNGPLAPTLELRWLIMSKRMVFGDDGSVCGFLPGCGSTATTGCPAWTIEVLIARWKEQTTARGDPDCVRQAADGTPWTVVQVDPASRCTPEPYVTWWLSAPGPWRAQGPASRQHRRVADA